MIYIDFLYLGTYIQLILVTGIIKDLNTHAWKVFITIIIIIYCKEELKLGIVETGLGQRHKIQIKYKYHIIIIIYYIICYY